MQLMFPGFCSGYLMFTCIIYSVAAEENWRALSYITPAIFWKVTIQINSKGLEAKPAHGVVYTGFTSVTGTQ